MEDHLLWRVAYAIPGESRVIGVVRAATPSAAVEKIEQAENALGRGPVDPDSTHVERAHATAGYDF